MVGGSLLPLTLLIAAILHAALFLLVDLRPISESSIAEKSDIVRVDIIHKDKPAPIAKIALAPMFVPKPVKTKPEVSIKPIQKTVIAKPVEQVVKDPIAAELEVPAPVQTPVAVVEKPVIPKFSDTASLEIKYRDKVRDIISSNKKYPVIARRRGMQGSAVVYFEVMSDGIISNSIVVASSGFDMLDQTALEILAESSPLPVPPKHMEFSLPIVFRLN